jgi:hypothetical protein
MDTSLVIAITLSVVVLVGYYSACVVVDRRIRRLDMRQQTALAVVIAAAVFTMCCLMVD